MKKIITLLIFLLLVVSGHSLNALIMDEIVATVNGEPIMLSELEYILKPIYARAESTYEGEELELYRMKARDELLQQLIENKLILQKAKEEGVDVTDAGIAEQLAETKEKFNSMEEFEEALKREGLTLDEYKDTLKEQIIIRTMMERNVVYKAKAVPEEIEAYYNEHKEKIGKPLSEVWGQIEDRVFKIKLRLEHAKWIESLKEKAYIDIKQ